MLKRSLIACLFFWGLQTSTIWAQDGLEDDIGVGETPGATDQDIKVALGSQVVQDIILPGALAFGPGELEAWAKQAKEAYAKLESEVALGDPSKTYDVIIQPGHFQRKTGRTGGQGAYVSEKEMAAWIARDLSNDLSKRGFNVLVIPADGFRRPLKGKMFLSFHTDASDFPCSIDGPSLGYGRLSDAIGVHGVAIALAISLGVDPVKFMKDNYTKNLKGYYAFSAMEPELFEGVIEMSELTCPDQEKNMLSHQDVLSKNLAIAVALLAKPAN